MIRLLTALLIALFLAASFLLDVEYGAMPPSTSEAAR